MTEAVRLNPCLCGCTRGVSPSLGAAGWHVRRGPMPVLEKRWGHVQFSNWIDHPYRFRLSTGAWCYVAEPYQLWGDDFGDLAYLAERGFHVSIHPRDARHVPGGTLAIWIYEGEIP